jgi:hypothetical protein
MREVDGGPRCGITVCVRVCLDDRLLRESYVLSLRKRAFKGTWQYPALRKNRAPRSSDRAKCYVRVRSWHGRNMWVNGEPNDPPDVKLDVEYVTDVTVFELGDELAGIEVPNLDRLVVTCADESTTDWVKREGANE